MFCMAADEWGEFRMEEKKYNCSDVSTFPFHFSHHEKNYLIVDEKSWLIFSVVIVDTLIVSEKKRQILRNWFTAVLTPINFSIL